MRVNMKIISLVKACMTDNMNIFKIKKRANNDSSNKAFLMFIIALFTYSIWSYATLIIEPLKETKSEYALLTFFGIITAILTLIEGIYKSSSLMFNCNDDDLLLSLPIKRSTVLFIRVFKFYVFEIMYNALFLIPALVVYILSNINTCTISFTYNTYNCILHNWWNNISYFIKI